MDRIAFVQQPHCGLLPSCSWTSAGVSDRPQLSSTHDLTSLSERTLQEQMIMSGARLQERRFE
jgi:hypothetical protein